jgi:hypothetical protein
MNGIGTHFEKAQESCDSLNRERKRAPNTPRLSSGGRYVAGGGGGALVPKVAGPRLRNS